MDAAPGAGCGLLWVVATPIGNLEDVTARALAALRACDLVVAEDTRVTARLLARYDIHKPLLACFEHSDARRVAEIAERLAGGARVALVSDAGTPGISDPGVAVVRAAVAQGIPVIPLPGPSAVAAALSASGLPADRFVFEGFLPRSGRERAARLAALAAEERTAVLYEAPHRIRETLEDLAQAVGARPLVLCRELTKLHEETLRGTAAELAAAPSVLAARGEFVLVLAGRAAGAGEAAGEGAAAAPADEATLAAALTDAAARGLTRTAAVREVVGRYDAPRAAVYALALRVLGPRRAE